MSDLPRLPNRGSSSPAPPPPPPAPVQQQTQTKYSHRAASALARFAQPFLTGSRPPSPHGPGVHTDLSAAVRSTRSRSLPGSSQTVTHKTGISIATLDISPQRTHAVVGGKEILKTVRVLPDHSSEEFNLRNAIISYSSTHHVGGGVSARHKDQLTVKDVKWSHGPYDQIIATAVANGRIVVYDLHRTGLELCRFQGHSRQVHRLAFNPHRPAWLLSGSQDATIRMWDLRTIPTDPGVAICGSRDQFTGNSDAIRDVRWSPVDGVLFATATDSGAIQLWDCRKTGSPLLRITAHDRPCYSVDWHPDGKHIVSGGTDRQVKVWDFSSTGERRQKPTFQFRTPQAVLNVRWRPPSWAKELEGSGDWQSSQVVTSYDKEDPRIHLWDLRRPHIPFREFDRHDSHTTDLLWHSKDLLWTVGDGGAFTQTDIRYAPQVVNQRPTCSVAWSPSGGVIAFAQKRPRRSILGLSTNEFIGHSGVEDAPGETLSQSPSDEIAEEPLFAALRPRHSKSSSVRTSKSLGSTPPTTTDLVPILPIEKLFPKATPPGLRQTGIMGIVDGATMDRETFRYLAQQYFPLLECGLDREQTGLLRTLLDSLNHNAQCAEDISLLKLAQTWRIVKYAIIEELQTRQREERHASEKRVRSIKKKASKDDPITEKVRNMEDARQEKMKSRFFKGVIESEHPKYSLSELESASNMTTPLAQPLPDSPPDSYDSSISQIRSSLNDAEAIQPLPPSVLSSNHETIGSNGWSSMSDLEPRPFHETQHRESIDSEGVHVLSDSPPINLPRDSVLHDVQEEQRSAPLAIAGREDWHIRRRPRLTKEFSEADEFDQKLEEKRAAIRDYKYLPKRLLSLESHTDSAKPSFHRHESSESFPMFSASTTSSHPSKSPAASFNPGARMYDASEGDGVADGHDVSTRNETLLRTHNDSAPSSSSIAEEPFQAGEFYGENFTNNNHLHLDRPSTPPPLLKESTPLMTIHHKEQERVAPPTAMNSAWTQGIHELGDNLSQILIPIISDPASNNPWSAETLLREAIRHYHSSTHVDMQSAAHLLQKLHLLFEDCENILPSEESENIFKAYNENLLRQSMYIEAAELRLLCVPSYPAVYEYAQGDTYMNVFCFTCKRPYENPKNDNTRCYRCNTSQEVCAVCMSVDPPPEWIARENVSLLGASHDLDSDLTSHLHSSSRSSLRTELIPPSEHHPFGEPHPEPYQPTRPKGTTLWSWCQGCGHGGHLACIKTWLKDIEVSEGGCATPGCMHDCGPGPRREHNRNILLEESKKRDSASRKAGVGFVKRDTWTRGESKAVEKVRGMLGVGATGSASTATTMTTSIPPSGTSSNLMSSPKKVRLVTPSEQEKPPRGGSTRTSLG
ncbi:WD repeat protein [Aspergillus lucknowensis]|uniref:WD repeat protein n=1 Tax=Aspergillus lucknowensis TaxID=176173 RepID=A0ABR4LV06_9EURO